MSRQTYNIEVTNSTGTPIDGASVYWIYDYSEEDGTGFKEGVTVEEEDDETSGGGLASITFECDVYGEAVTWPNIKARVYHDDYKSVEKIVGPDGGTINLGDSKYTNVTVKIGTCTNATSAYIGTSATNTPSSTEFVMSTKSPLYLKVNPSDGYALSTISLSGDGGYGIISKNTVSNDFYDAYINLSNCPNTIQTVTINIVCSLSLKLTVTQTTGGTIYYGEKSYSTDFATRSLEDVGEGTTLYVKCVCNSGYNFVSWSATGATYTYKTTSSTGGYFVFGTSDVVLKAKFEVIQVPDEPITEYDNWGKYKLTLKPNSYTVTFNGIDGVLRDTNDLIGFWGENLDKTSGTKTVEFNSDSLKNVGIAVKDGYGFNGWFTAATDGVGVFDANGNFMAGTYFTSDGKWKYPGNLSLYAQFGTNGYYVKYNPNCNESLDGQTMDNSYHKFDVEKKLSKNKYTRSHYKFLYWTTESNGGTIYNDEQVVINLTNVNNSTFNLYAQWKNTNAQDTDRELVLVYDYNKMSINNIKTSIENGNVEFGKTSTINYRLKIDDPDSVNTLDIFTVSPVLESDKNVVSSVDIAMKKDVNDLNMKIINRYSGYYNPIFKDILFFDDYTDEDGNVKQYSHTTFDYNYKDSLGEFGFIKNLWFHKVNSEKTNILGTKEARYPMTGEYAIDTKDYNVFSTSWDKGYYTKQADINNSEVCESIESMKEKLCMFGSKYLNVPEKIEIECFNDGGEWNDEWISNSSACEGEVMYKEINDSSVNFYFFIHKRLMRFFCDKLREEFEKYVNPTYSFGEKDSIDDDIEEYVRKNILNLYELKRINVYVKREKKGVNNSKIENEYGAYLDKTVDELKEDGFTQINTVSMTKKSTDEFDRQLTYNLRNGEKEYFGFKIYIKKI